MSMLCIVWRKNVDIDKARVLIIEGLSMIEGCCPVSCIVPALHCLCHYADGAAKHGLLRLLWMINFGELVLFVFYTFYYISLLLLLFLERHNKKCKNLTGNKDKPIASLANALVRDGTARYFRWRRGESTTRVDKIPVTTLTGDSKLVQLSDAISRLIQPLLLCGCRLDHSTVYEHLTGKIGGKRFNSGEKLRVGMRCGSVVTMVIHGKSVYGLVKKFYRVFCECDTFVDLTVVTWFPLPTYPDCDPLTVVIRIRGLDINNIPRMCVVPLHDIQPSRIGVEIDNGVGSMYMLRMDGTDSNVVFE